MEPHTAIAVWTDDELTLYCSSQGVHLTGCCWRAAFGLDAARIRVISPHVGGGVRLEGVPRRVRRPGAHGRAARPGPAGEVRAHPPADVHAGRLPPRRRSSGSGSAPTPTAGSSRSRTSGPADGQGQGVRRADRGGSRVMYAAPNRRTTHRWPPWTSRCRRSCAVPARRRACSRWSRRWTSWRSRCGLDPIEFRIRNEPEVHPESGLPFSSRHLVACLREGARRFGWERRDPGAAGAARGRLADRDRRGRLDLPVASPAREHRDDPGRRRRALHGADRRRRHRYRHLDGAHPDRRRRAGRRRRGRRPADRGHRAAASRRAPASRRGSTAGARRSTRRPASCGRALDRARRQVPAEGLEVTADDARQPVRRAVRDVQLRRPVRRGPGARGHRRGAGAAPARGVRRAAGSSTRRPPARS